MISNYRCTFGLKEGKSTSVMQKQMPSQREQYGNTIHLFIGTGRSPCKITLMPFTFINNSIVILRGLIWLSFLSRFPFPPLCRSSSAHSFVIVLSFVVIAVPVKLCLNHALVY
jgi:hypothetical protein